MSLERDSEVRVQLNLHAVSLASRKCALYMFHCKCEMCVCANASLSLHWHPLTVIMVAGVKTRLWTKWAKTNREVRVCTYLLIQICYVHMCG